MRTSGPARVLAVLISGAALLAIAAGCSASGSSSTGQTGASTSGASTSGPGTSGTGTSGASQGTGTSAADHDTPQAAVSGFSTAELAGNWARVCSFWMPSQQAACRSTKLAHVPTGKVTVGNAVISGNLALVGVTGRVCLSKSQCQGNTNPSAGMPTGSVSFQQAYSTDLNSNAFSPVPCIKVDGKWYLNTTSS
jgi:hypothetical protein